MALKPWIRTALWGLLTSVGAASCADGPSSAPPETTKGQAVVVVAQDTDRVGPIAFQIEQGGEVVASGTIDEDTQELNSCSPALLHTEDPIAFLTAQGRDGHYWVQEIDATAWSCLRFHLTRTTSWLGTNAFTIEDPAKLPAQILLDGEPAGEITGTVSRDEYWEMLDSLRWDERLVELEREERALLVARPPGSSQYTVRYRGKEEGPFPLEFEERTWTFHHIR